MPLISSLYAAGAGRVAWAEPLGLAAQAFELAALRLWAAQAPSGRRLLDVRVAGAHAAAVDAQPQRRCLLSAPNGAWWLDVEISSPDWPERLDEWMQHLSEALRIHIHLQQRGAAQDGQAMTREGNAAQQFGLTPAELRVAQSLAAGLDVKSIARRYAISVNTVRTQVQAALEKTRTGRQADLVRVMLALPSARDAALP
ncbi:MAG TPA: helix-turn-helix transcriptional regulator [Ramlibacter sp.]|nr:helix-turn-helix transcriptional regulator [Ramlibacter sp.]